MLTCHITNFLKKIFLVNIVLTLLGIVVFSPFTPVHAVLYNGASAIDALGQYDGSSLTNPQPFYLKSTTNDTPNRLGFSGPGMSVFDLVHHRFFLVDGSNNRVLVYNLATNNTFPDRIPDNVLGQPNFILKTSATTAGGIRNPVGIDYDSIHNRLFVSESTNNRVLIFDVSTITDGQNAVNVLGQSDFVSSAAADTQAGLNSPEGVVYDGTNNRLFVAQFDNRVTLYDVASITNGENAINVLGQPNFTSNTAATTQAGMNAPFGLAYDATNNRLFVSQITANRVTVYDVSPGTITNGENALNVVGQSSFASSTAATTIAGLSNPRGITYDSATDRLFVTGNGNNRVTIYNVATSTLTNGPNAVNVLGQVNFTSSTVAITQAGMSGPQGVSYDNSNNRLLVSQSGGSRVTVYDAATTTIVNGENALDLLGQYDGTSMSDPQPSYTKSGANDTPNRLGFNFPFHMALDSIHHRFFLVDLTNNRVLVYNLNTDNTFPDRVPDNVLGQSDFISNSATTTQAGLSTPEGIAYDGVNNRLFVSDFINNRVVIYDVATIANGENASNVLGQLNFTSNAAATTQASTRSPVGLAYDSVNNRLFVAQTSNSQRVTVFNVATSTLTNGQNASNVLGQPNFTSNTAATTQAGMNNPFGVALDESTNRLFVAGNNNRVTVYDVSTSTISNGENATFVLGQSDFTSSGATTTQSGLSGARGLLYDSTTNHLFVSELGNNRVTIFDGTTPVPGFTIAETASSTTITEGSVTDTFTVVLNSQPTNNVALSLSSDLPASATTSLSALTFTSSTWNIPQTIIVSAPLDLNTINELATLTITVNDGLSDSQYVSVADQTVMVQVTDAGGGFMSTETASSTVVTEGGATDTFTVVLTAQPTNNVVLNISSSLPDSVTTSPSILTFTSSTWNLPQTITVSAPEDPNTTNETVTLTLAINTAQSDSQFNTALPQMIMVNVTDNDMSGGGGSGSSGGITYGGGGAGVVYGCTDRIALNYNYIAFVNDGSCRYAAAPLTSVSTTSLPITTSSPMIPLQPSSESSGTSTCTIQPYLTKELRYGAKNNPADVKLLESFLNTYEHTDLPIDGVYSKKIVAAVIAWQEKYAAEILAPWKLKKGTGIISVTSLKKIRETAESSCNVIQPTPPSLCIPENTVLRRGSNSEAVRTAQTILFNNSFLLATPNGNFGPATEAAVKAFQSSLHLPKTGSISSLTRTKLNELGCGT